MSAVDTKSICVEYPSIGSSDDGDYRDYSLIAEGATFLELVGNAYIWEVDQDGGDHDGGPLSDYRQSVYATGIRVIREACQENGIWVPDTPCEFCLLTEATVDAQYCKTCAARVQAFEIQKREREAANAQFWAEREREGKLYAEYSRQYGGIKSCRTYDEHHADMLRGVPSFEDWKKSHARQGITLADLWAHTGDAEDFPEDSDAYFAMRAIEIHGSALRDNSLAELVAIGKRDEAGNE
jgi:hypothetical protein